MKPDHYFSEKPSSKLKIREVTAVIKRKVFNFKASSGVFSAKKLDKGTRLLVESMIIKEDDAVLDLGCGIGVVGIVASTLTRNEVFLTDINERACKMAKLNSEGIKNIKVIQGNMFEPVKGKKFDVILLNPPQTAGKKACFEMIKESAKHLKEGGSLQIVARHKKGGESLSKKMLEVFGNIKVIAKNRGYWVYASKLA